MLRRFVLRWAVARPRGDLAAPARLNPGVGRRLQALGAHWGDQGPLGLAGLAALSALPRLCAGNSPSKPDAREFAGEFAQSRALTPLPAGGLARQPRGAGGGHGRQLPWPSRAGGPGGPQLRTCRALARPPIGASLAATAGALLPLGGPRHSNAPALAGVSQQAIGACPATRSPSPDANWSRAGPCSPLALVPAPTAMLPCAPVQPTAAAVNKQHS